MAVIRWFVGFFKALFRIWDQEEWFYYAKTGLDPRIPAFQRWDVLVREELKTPETEAEELLRPRNYRVILHDKYMQTPEEVIFFTTDKDKIDALEAQYRRELDSRTSGDFYYRMVKGRQLDFYHNYKIASEAINEGAEVDEETRREMFIR